MEPELPDALSGRKSRVKLPRTFAALQYRNYQLYFGGQLISVAGTWMQIIAQGWLVYQISHSESALGLVAFASAIPVLVVSPWAGVVVDRAAKRNLLVVTQAAAMVLAFILSALSFAGIVQVWHIMILAAALGIVNAFDSPARQAFLVEMVGKEHLTNGIALNSMMFNGARVLGPALGGLLLAAVGPTWCFFLNGLSFIAVIIGLLAMQVPYSRPALTSQGTPIKLLASGFIYSVSHSELGGLLLLATFFSVFGLAYNAVLPAFVDQVLKVGATGYGGINAAVGVGAVIGAFLVAGNNERSRRGPIMILAYIGYTAFLLLFAFNPIYPLALVLAFGLGIGFMLVFTMINSLIQLNVEDQMRGRIMSLYTLTFAGFAPFGNLAIGSLSESWGLSQSIALFAFISLVLAVITIYKIPKIRTMR